MQCGVVFPDIPGVVAWGRAMDEVLHYARKHLCGCAIDVSNACATNFALGAVEPVEITR